VHHIRSPMAGSNNDLIATIMDEETVYEGYISVLRRRVNFSLPPDRSIRSDVDGTHAADLVASRDQCVDFDVVGNPSSNFKCAVVFPFHAATREVTLVREYAHGPARFAFALPSGKHDPALHKDVQETAVLELEEEAQLTGGIWHPLLPAGHPGIPEVKWCANAFTPFLCIDPTRHHTPKPRDWEETISGQNVERVSLLRFTEMLAGASLLLPSIATGYMALDKLKMMGFDCDVTADSIK
jgi:8-oxo-dGTP pyrophosphatase MutT (NUDIX family)